MAMVLAETYVCRPQPGPAENAEQDKKGHLWMDTKEERRKIDEANKRGIRRTR